MIQISLRFCQIAGSGLILLIMYHSAPRRDWIELKFGRQVKLDGF